MTNATTENAEAIRDHTDRALAYLIKAEKELRDALALAERDYDHNDNKLRQIVGTAQLLSSSLSMEHFTWADYARARTRAESRLRCSHGNIATECNIGYSEGNS